jgi:type IV pilus assembly protein PilA
MLTSVLERLNDRRDAAADLGEDAGFTLIELMVVLLILAILLAIAIPTFLGVTGGANDRAAQSNINTSLTTAKAMATQNNQQYIDLAAAPAQDKTTQFAVVKSNEPSITWNLDATVATQGPVSVHFSTDGNGVIVASYSKNSKTCWIAVDNLQAVGTPVLPAVETAPYGVAAGSAVTYPSGAGTFYAKSTADCNANTAPAGAVWGNKF